MGQCMINWGLAENPSKCSKEACQYWRNKTQECSKHMHTPDTPDPLLIIAKYKRELEQILREYIHPATFQAILTQKEQDLKATQALCDHYRLRAEHLAADLKKHRDSKCVCCLYGDKKATELLQWSPCRDCQSPISNYGDAWVYKEPI